MNWIEKQQAQCAYVAACWDTVKSTRLSGTVVQQSAAVDEMDTALNGSAQMLADHNSVTIGTMSGGTGCGKTYAAGLP